jgi:hypothetical protein
MPLQFFKANKNLKGCGIGLSFQSKDEAFYVSLVKQSAWDDQKQRGSFQGDKTNIKLSVTEVGGILDCIERNREFSTYHKSKRSNTQIKFAAYMVQGEEKPIQKGFGLSVNQTDVEDTTKKVSFLMPINFAEARAIKKYLEFALEHIYSAIYSADKEFFKKKQAEGGRPQVSNAKASTPPEPVQPEDDLINQSTEQPVEDDGGL